MLRIKMWLHLFDVISQSMMSGHNHMLYKYYRNCSGIYMQPELVYDYKIDVMQRL